MFEVLFINKDKRTQNSFAVIKVDEAVQKVIITHGRKIYIGLSSCWVSERYHLIQCYRCQAFGHKMDSERCKHNKSRASKDELREVCNVCNVCEAQALSVKTSCAR